LDKGGRVTVNPDLSLPPPGSVRHRRPGPRAQGKWRAGARCLPGRDADGRHVARIIESELDLGSGADPAAVQVLGPRHHGHDWPLAAVAWIGRIHISGWFAWLAWLLVHLVFLIGFRNRLAVLLQ